MMVSSKEDSFLMAGGQIKDNESLRWFKVVFQSSEG